MGAVVRDLWKGLLECDKCGKDALKIKIKEHSKRQKHQERKQRQKERRQEKKARKPSKQGKGQRGLTDADSSSSCSNSSDSDSDSSSSDHLFTPPSPCATRLTSDFHSASPHMPRPPCRDGTLWEP